MTTSNATTLGQFQLQAFHALQAGTFESAGIYLAPRTANHTHILYKAVRILEVDGEVSRAIVLLGLRKAVEQYQRRAFTDVTATLREHITIPADHTLIGCADDNDALGSVFFDSDDILIAHDDNDPSRAEQVSAVFRVFTSNVRAAVFLRYGPRMHGRFRDLLAAPVTCVEAPTYAELGEKLAALYAEGLANIPRAQAELASLRASDAAA